MALTLQNAFHKKCAPKSICTILKIKKEIRYILLILDFESHILAFFWQLATMSKHKIKWFLFRTCKPQLYYHISTISRFPCLSQNLVTVTKTAENSIEIFTVWSTDGNISIWTPDSKKCRNAEIQGVYALWKENGGLLKFFQRNRLDFYLCQNLQV